MIEVNITTYNRLPYLQKCVWSILASTQKEFRIMVSDDGSTDGTIEWLKMMGKRKLLEFKLNNGLGTASNYNFLMRLSKTSYPLITNDDMYFFRGWDLLEIPEDCGTLTINNVAGNVNTDIYDVKVFNPKYYGNIACTFIYKPLWQEIGFKFNRPKEGKRLGYFGNSFIELSEKADIKQNKHYISKPNFAMNMERKTSKLTEYQHLIDNGYIDERKKWRKGHACNYGIPDM